MNNLSQCAETELFIDSSRAQKSLIESECAERIGQIAAVQFQETRNGVDVLTDPRVGRIQDGQGLLLSCLFEAKSEEKETIVNWV